MPRTESQVPLKGSYGPAGLADWAEATMFVEQRRRLSRTKLGDRLANLLFPGEGDAAEGDLEEKLDELLTEVSRRAQAAPYTYPFMDPLEESSGSLTRNQDVDEFPYQFLLWLSVSERYRKERRTRAVEEPFDNLVKRALAAYLGPEACAVRFAHPSKEGRPRTFPKAIEWLAGLLSLSVGSLAARPARKDGGVDVVAWRPFPDERSAFLVVLCQCTVQSRWTSKGENIVLNQWTDWITLGTPPLKALAIPFVVPPGTDERWEDDEKWEEARRSVNLIFDRYRLSGLVRPEETEQVEEMKEWVEAESALFKLVRP